MDTLKPKGVSFGAEERRIPMNQVVIEALKSQPRILHNPYVLYGRDAGLFLKNAINLLGSANTIDTSLSVTTLSLYGPVAQKDRAAVS